MKVSIIIPVYNVEKYLEKCVDSVIKQKYANLEIILVNDGSTDSSGKICDDYEVLDNRIKVIHKPNGGLMSAWKAGYFSSTGKYIGFVDSDDWIDDNMYEELVLNIMSHKADIAVCQLIKEFNQSTNIKERLRLKPGVYNLERIKNEIIPGIINDGTFLGRKLSPNRVTKLFKRELIRNNIQFFDNNISLGEDLITSFSCICDAKKIVILSEFYPYHYRNNTQSITGKYDEKRIEDVRILNYKLQHIATVKGINVVQQIANDFISLALLCIEFEILFSPFSKKTILLNIMSIYSSEIFYASLKEGNTKKFSLKYRFYLFLLKRRKYEILYLSRRIITNLKNII